MTPYLRRNDKNMKALYIVSIAIISQANCVIMAMDKEEQWLTSQMIYLGEL